MNFDYIMKRAKEQKKILSVACADDEPVLKACINAYKEGICTPVFVGNKENMEKIAKKESLDLKPFEIIDEKNPTLAAEKAVKLVSSKQANFLMKGYVDTSILGKAVLNKEWGLRTNRLLSHVSIFEIPAYHKMFLLSDSGFIIKPDLSMKVDIINNAVDVYHKLGVESPKVAILSAIEKINPDMPETIDAALLSAMNRRGQIKGCTIDGPLAFDLAISKESAEHKKVKSEVAGEADIMIVPDIASGNILAKALIYWTDSKFAGIIVGADANIVLISRSDNEINKMMSIAFGAI